MIKTFDFLYQAWRDASFMEEILQHLRKNGYSEMKTDILILQFDGYAQTVTILSRSSDDALSARIIPKRITYDAMRKLLNCDFEHFSPGDISDALDGG